MTQEAVSLPYILYILSSKWKNEPSERMACGLQQPSQKYHAQEISKFTWV